MWHGAEGRYPERGVLIRSFGVSLFMALLVFAFSCSSRIPMSSENAHCADSFCLESCAFSKSPEQTYTEHPLSQPPTAPHTFARNKYPGKE